MPAGNEVTVSVLDNSPVTVTVAGASGSSPTITNGGTATVTVTSAGDRGLKGDTGPANTLTIGTVTNGNAPSATLTGTAPNQVLNLVLQKGQDGAPGATGAAGSDGAVGPAGPAGSFATSQTVSAKTGSYTLVLGDAGSLITVSSSSSSSITIPPFSSVAFPVGTHVDIVRLGTGDVRALPGTGVTVNTTTGQFLRARYSAATIVNIAQDTWVLIGDVV